MEASELGGEKMKLVCVLIACALRECCALPFRKRLKLDASWFFVCLLFPALCKVTDFAFCCVIDVVFVFACLNSIGISICMAIDALILNCS